MALQFGEPDFVDEEGDVVANTTSTIISTSAFEAQNAAVHQARSFDNIRFSTPLGQQNYFNSQHLNCYNEEAPQQCQQRSTIHLLNNNQRH